MEVRSDGREGAGEGWRTRKEWMMREEKEEEGSQQHSHKEKIKRKY